MSDYALASLVELRAHEVTAAQRAHVEAERQLEAAQAQTAALVRAHRLHEEATQASASEPSSAADALALHAWRLRRREEARALLERIQQAQQEERATERNVSESREALHAALREKQSIDAHHARWKQAEGAKALRDQEDESDERRR